MKHLTFIFFFLFMTNLYAAKDKTEFEGLYIVPTSADLMEHSRFKVKIIKPFSGYSTEKISYIFPEVLIGEANKEIELTKVVGTLNSWDSPLMTADCTVLDDIFSCNITLKKEVVAKLNIFSLFFPQAYAESILLSKDKSLVHLMKMDFSVEDAIKLTSVIEKFFSNEPAGFLSYEFQ